MITISAIRHVPLSEDAALSFGQTLEIRLRTRAGEPLEVSLFYGDRVSMTDPIPVTQVKMKRIGCDGVSDIYGTCVHSPYTRFCYYFRICEKEGSGDPLVIYYSEHGFDPEPTTDRTQFFQYPYLRREDLPGAPVWGKDTLLYHIFPDSFADQKAGISDRSFEVTGEDGQTSRAKHGGTLRGVTENLPYIRDLGMNCIYLNPIFRSASCHKYDTIDYYEIDPSLGTADDLHELIDTAHSMDMYVMLDAVFNHTSPDFFAFRNIKQNGKSSPYINWYYMEDFPIFYGTKDKKPNFKSFAYYGGMPKLNMANPATADYFVQVGLHYVREFHIDGWRLDVADEVGHAFWKKFRYCLKAENPNLLIVGENWHYAPDFLTGDEWDSLMNYPFYKALTGLICYNRLTATGFVNELSFLKGQYQSQVLPLLWNMIDSHDVERFLHTAGHDKKKQKLAAALMLLLPGMPMIYYGDEVGLDGGFDPDNRRGMIWDEDKADWDMFAWYKRLLSIRRQYASLSRGECEICADDDLGVITIQLNDKTLAVLNVTSQTLSFEDLTEQSVMGEKLLRFNDSFNLLQDGDFSCKIAGLEAVILQLK